MVGDAMVGASGVAEAEDTKAVTVMEMVGGGGRGHNDTAGAGRGRSAPSNYGSDKQPAESHYAL